MGNIFLEVDGEWKTPGAEKPGHVLARVRESISKEILPVEESLLDADSVARATSGFPATAGVGIRPIAELDGRALQTRGKRSAAHLSRQCPLNGFSTAREAGPGDPEASGLRMPAGRGAWGNRLSLPSRSLRHFSCGNRLDGCGSSVRCVKRQEELAPELAAWCPAREAVSWSLGKSPLAPTLPDAETTLGETGASGLAGARLEETQARSSSTGPQWAVGCPGPGSLTRATFGLRKGRRFPMEERPRTASESRIRAGPSSHRPRALHPARRDPRRVLLAGPASAPDRDRSTRKSTRSGSSVVGPPGIRRGRRCPVEILVVTKSGRADATLRDYFGKSDRVIDVDPEEPAEGIFLGRRTFPERTPAALGDTGTARHFSPAVRRARRGRPRSRCGRAGEVLAISFGNGMLRAGRLHLPATERKAKASGSGRWHRTSISMPPGSISSRSRRRGGFVCPAAKLALLSDAEILGRSASQSCPTGQLSDASASGSGRAAMDFSEFEEDDLRRTVSTTELEGFLGSKNPPTGTAKCWRWNLRTAHGFTFPLDQAWQISRYVGLGRRHPDLSELGDGRWQKAKAKASKGIYEYAARMLKIQAERENGTGHAFPSDSHWQQDSRSRSSSPRPRTSCVPSPIPRPTWNPCARWTALICGDVGFGKTEVAIRAAFKAVTGGRQAVIITPTTVLAQRHFRTFRERMSGISP